jgi:ankyrin repeat protein
MAPIYSAASRGELEEITRLVEEDGRQLNAQNENGDTPIMVAAERGKDSVVTRLIALRADMGAKNRREQTAAHLACGNNRASTLALLIDTCVQDNRRRKTQ